jgi:hypothetical protein
MDPNKEAEMETITDYVTAYRAKHDIQPTLGRKHELSCVHFGEGYNLLYRQLVLTDECHDGWLELNSPEVRAIVLEQIAKDQ